MRSSESWCSHACDQDILFFNDTATTEIYTLSLHDALPISSFSSLSFPEATTPEHDARRLYPRRNSANTHNGRPRRSEEHTSELQSRQYLVCRLLLEKNINSALPYVNTDDSRISVKRSE